MYLNVSRENDIIRDAEIRIVRNNIIIAAVMRVPAKGIGNVGNNTLINQHAYNIIHDMINRYVMIKMTSLL